MMTQKKPIPKPRRLPLRFRDRESILKALRGQLHHLISDPLHLAVMNLVGLGGAGKTSLLQEFSSYIQAAAPRMRVVRLTLDRSRRDDSPALLHALREQMGADCLLFDSALLSYWTAVGHPFTVRPGGSIADGLAVKSIEAGGSFAGVPLPLGFAIDLYRRARRATLRRFRYREGHFKEIDALRGRPDELETRLPYYLGQDIFTLSGDAASPRTFLLDGYDWSGRSADSWLRELIAVASVGLWVISGRQPLRWPSREWNEVLEEIPIGPFSEELTSQIVQVETDAPPDVVKHIARISEGLPFFVEALIRDYEDVRISDSDVGKYSGHLAVTRDEVLQRILRHLPRDDANAVLALAAIGVFDEALAHEVGLSLGLPIGLSFWTELLASYFVEPVDIDLGVYKLHDLLTSFIRKQRKNRRRLNLAYAAVARQVYLRCAANPGDPVAVILFGAAIGSVQDLHDPPVEAVEFIIDAGFLMHDMGLWNELTSACAPETEPSGMLGAGEVAARLFWAICLRRHKGIDAAIEALNGIRDMAYLLGRHEISYDVELSYVNELAGRYAESRRKFVSLQGSDQLAKAPLRTRVRLAMYHADMQIMDGELQSASNLLLETWESLDHKSSPMAAELLRHRAHAFRFSLLFEQAEAGYLQADATTSASSGFHAKLITNLAENRCWLRPEEARACAEEAIDLNGRVGNTIEVGKAHAALAIALSGLSDAEQAPRHARQAIEIAHGVGYEAGVLFGELALVAASSAIGQTREAAFALRRVEQGTRRLDTYRHLLVTAFAARGDLVAAIKYSTHFRWIESESIPNRLAGLSRRPA